MGWSGESGSNGPVNERQFSVRCEDRTVPGVLWEPTASQSDQIVLLGHGGAAHKKSDYIELIAHELARLGIASMAIDGPSHGDRVNAVLTQEPSADGHTPGDFKTFAKVWADTGGTEAIVADWAAALDFVEAEQGTRPTGWWGVSMGTMMGLPVTASDERIRVAVLGLMGNWGPNGAELIEMAPEVSQPVRFLLQWDDELVPRQPCLELFDALASARKSMHVNPGAHSDVPVHEIKSSLEFLAYYLNRAKGS